MCVRVCACACARQYPGPSRRVLVHPTCCFLGFSTVPHGLLCAFTYFTFQRTGTRLVWVPTAGSQVCCACFCLHTGSALPEQGSGSGGNAFWTFSVIDALLPGEDWRVCAPSRGRSAAARGGSSVFLSGALPPRRLWPL